MFDYKTEKIEYSYFNVEAIVEENEGTYADKDSDLHLIEVGWNHSLDEVIGSILSNNLTLKHFQEYDYSPYNCFNGMKQLSERKFIIEKHDKKLPLVYSLVTTKQ